jgi:hypothetical protein
MSDCPLPEPGARVCTKWGIYGTVQPYQRNLPAVRAAPVRLDDGVTRMLGPDQFTVQPQPKAGTA